MRHPSSPATRRSFLAGTAGTFASIAVVRSGARAAEFSYKFACNTALEHPLTVRAREMFARIKKDTGGRLEVAMYPASQLGGDAAMVTQLRSGAIQFHTQSGSILAQIAPLAAVQGLPFAFKDSAAVFAALDGDVGAQVRADIDSRGMHAFPGILENGFRQITSSTHPIRTVDDLTGFKIRTPTGPLWVDLFKTLGANVAAISIAEVYTALQTKVVDGQENPYNIIEFNRFYEVQKYCSITNHMWDGWWFLANADAWKALPPDIQQVVEHHQREYTRAQRTDIKLLNDSLASKLSRRGLTFNTTNVATFKPRLKEFYGRWKTTFGDKMWAALEKTTGALG